MSAAGASTAAVSIEGGGAAAAGAGRTGSCIFTSPSHSLPWAMPMPCSSAELAMSGVGDWRRGRGRGGEEEGRECGG